LCIVESHPPHAAHAARRRAAALAGHEGDAAAARELLDDPDPTVRATALGALARLGALAPALVLAHLRDPDPAVRRRACEVAARAGFVADGTVAEGLVAVLDDPDATVVETAAWALGELGARPAVPRLAEVATGHDDALCREAAVAALGAIGDAAGLPAVLAACRDRATVRRRAVIALAAFEGSEVDAALRTALDDRDWQVRQAAEDLLRE